MPVTTVMDEPPGADKWTLTCERAAIMRTWFIPFAKIAAALDLSSPREAQQAVRQGIALMPAEDIVAVRKMEDDRLRHIADQLKAVIENEPQPLISDGHVIADPETGDVYPDQMARVRVLEALMNVVNAMRVLYARKPVITPDMVTERIKVLRRELGDEAADQIPGLRLPESGDPDEADPPG